MAIVSFWSDGKGETGKTASVAAIATQMSLENNFKILIFNTKHNDITMEDCFWNTVNVDTRLNFKETGKTDIDTGIKGLSKAILSNKTSPEIITNYTRTIFKNRLELLADSNILKEEYDKQRTLFKEMIRMANKYYDLVLVDLEGDINDTVISGILEISNIVVPTLSQSLRKINNHLKAKKEDRILSKENIMVLIGRYDKKSTYNLKNVARHIGEKQIYGIPYSTLFFESCNEGKVADYFIKFRKAKPSDNNGLVVNSVREFSEHLVEMLKVFQANI